eukprot:8639804-Pyramimonas_sp.AAC.1
MDEGGGRVGAAWRKAGQDGDCARRKGKTDNEEEQRFVPRQKRRRMSDSEAEQPGAAFGP